MKVCASINLGPWNHEARMFDSINAAVEYFRSEVAGIDYGTGLGSIESGDQQIMDLYPQCEHDSERCTSNMTFHDYPMVRYAVGPRGGIQRQNT